MDATARETYMTTQVMTATPQKLQVMLIEGAIRYARQVKQHWEQNEFDEAIEPLTRCRQIISEILCGFKRDGEENTDLTRQVSSLYYYLFKTLTEAQMEHEIKPIDDVIDILDIERETWRQVCEQLGSNIDTTAVTAAISVDTISEFVGSDKLRGTSPPLRFDSSTIDSLITDDEPLPPETGISFEA